MFIVNVEGAIRKDNKWIIIERSHKEEHAAGLLSLVGGKVEVENIPNVLENNLRREITEEIGNKVKENVKYLHSVSFTTDQGHYFSIKSYFISSEDIIRKDRVW